MHRCYQLSTDTSFYTWVSPDSARDMLSWGGWASSGLACVGRFANTDGVLCSTLGRWVLELVRPEPRSVDDGLRLLRSVGSLRHLELNMLEVEILSRLMEGRRTRNELVEGIFNVEKGGPDYVASYTKVRRGLEDLEGRGFVSAPLFAKEKPYRITSYAMQKVASVSPDIKQPRLMERIDPVIYVACLISGFAAYYVAGNISDPATILAVLPASFFILLGFSLARIWGTLRKVI
jgi:hypothetical protein